MTTMTESSRRAFLAAVAATGGAAAVLAAPGTVTAANDTGNASLPISEPRSFSTEVFPAPTPGVRYTYIQGDEFEPLVDGYVFTRSALQIESPSGIFFHSLAGLPAGSRIAEVTFAVVKSATLNGAGTYTIYRAFSGNIAGLDVRNNGALPVQAAEQYVSLVVDPAEPLWVVDNEQASTHQLIVSLSNSRVNSVRIGWVPGPATPLTFVPIAPKRAYDSRFVAPLGPLANNTSRIISVANSFVTGVGTIETIDIIPTTARAIAYNITIANTVGSGFLSVNPGDATAPGGSSINWFQSGMSLANGLVGKLDNNRQINVFCGGGGSTDFIVDINGYYL